ncbi:MAG: glycine--tRNA ligase [Candidatus Cardinium sp.]|uniref:glycine--tRNA ligase n=1 Tax=Cardinium endosymbiont of Dermatophagoides farinae TaxID=2597823 RepID=UPI001182BDD9|nr:glycine--tRNA ligase [Cardinium endosymbiont of Dermatophagoides farinae]TSJ81379.1 glycine--tRNA ligase [Cardinium endosymbiont of Dermatophagoides farinae]UWW97445.1 MAG: glycine--tRNA ligase [Candidatus Cardinium sp.]
MSTTDAALDHSNHAFKGLIAHAQAYGFIYPSSEIYDGLQSIYDYGPYGVALKRNLQNFWWQSMTQLHENIVGIDAAIMMHPTTWKASGHIDGFTDPMVDNKDSQKRYRVDLLIEEHAMQLVAQGKSTQAKSLMEEMERCLATGNLPGLDELLERFAIVCPLSKTAHWTPVRQFNLMFSTQMGAQNDGTTIYLRPETAQGIFVNFLNVQKTARMKLPFGIAQVGKAFRNEIIARQFIFRMREFEQMEMQFFIQPGTEKKWFDYWQETRKDWYSSLGINQEKINIHPHKQLAHYATAAVDIEYAFPFGSKEVEGIHSRTDFDLKRHEHYAKKKLQYFDPDLKQHYTPYVIETSVGLDRLVLMLLDNALTKTDDPAKRTYLKLPAPLAPIKAAIFPLVKKDGLAERALALFNALKYDFPLIYEETQSIGKRYTRQDLIGTPYCITIDYQTLEDETVTVRERDSMAQYRMKIAETAGYLHAATHIKSLLLQLKT